VLTGDEALDARVDRTRRIATISDADLSTLRKSAASTWGGQDAVFELAATHLAHGDANTALSVLRRWAEETGYEDTAVAAFVDVAIGSDHIEDCITGTDAFLQARPEDPWLFIARGVCLERLQRVRPSFNAYAEGLRLVGIMAGQTGNLEIELGLTARPPNIPDEAWSKERHELLTVLARASLVGHVALRHRMGIEPDAYPIDPRLRLLGGLRTEEIDRVFASRADAFRHCQLLQASRRTIPGGRLVLHVTIQRDGSPADIERVRSTFEDDDVPACLEHQVLNLWFPQPRYGNAVRYEREFRMAGD
jgi:Flp pilus assembly protein TadD